MTMRAKKSDKMKRLEYPSVSKVAVLMARAVAEWLEGMPPVRQKKIIIASLKSSSFLALVSAISAFISWAPARLKKADKKIGFEKSMVGEPMAIFMSC